MNIIQEKNMSNVFAVKFNRLDKELLIDGLIESIETAKKRMYQV
jgi:hypothetical protein